MTTYYISVNRHVVRSNKKNKETNPPFEVRTSKTQMDPQRVSALTYNNATVTLVYDPTAPLISGAVAWIQVEE